MTWTRAQFVGGVLLGYGSNGGVSHVRVENQFRAENSGVSSLSRMPAFLFGCAEAFCGLNFGVSNTTNCAVEESDDSASSF